MAEMTLIEASRYLSTIAQDAVGKMRDAAQAVLSHAGDMKKLEQAKLQAEENLSVVLERMVKAKEDEKIEKVARGGRVSASLVANEKILKDSKEKIQPTLQELKDLQDLIVEHKLKFESAKKEWVSEGNEHDQQMKIYVKRLAEIESKIVTAKKEIGAI